MSDPIQEQIYKDLDKIDLNLFKTVEKNILVVNTFGKKCPECKSDQINEQSKQTRSGDEGATKFYTCLTCGHEWRFNN